MRIREVLSDFEAELNQGRPLIKDLYEKFITEKKAENCSPYTLRYYENGVWNFISSFNLKFIDELTKDRVMEMIVSERETHQNCSIRTTNTKIMALRSFIYYCQRKGLLPIYQIKLLKSQDIPKETYSNEELKALIVKPKTRNWVEWRDWAVINYLIGTGNRASSVLNIRIKDVDFGNKCVSLMHTKNKKAQIVPLSDPLLKVLDVYLKTFEWTDEDYLFPTNEGKQWQLSSFQQEIAKYNRRRGVNKTSVHLFRHTFAKNYLLAGGSVPQLQRLLGHSTPQMSLHYAQIYGLEELSINYEKLNPLSQIMTK